jgi:hypothetical protein
VRKAVRDGRITLNAAGLIDPPSADRAWAQNTDTRKPSNSVNGKPAQAGRGARGGARPRPGPGKPAATVTLAAQNAERARWAAKREQLEYERRAGLLVDRAEAERHYFKLVRDARNQLDGLADRLGPELAPVTDPRVLTKRLRAEFKRLERQLAGEAPPAAEASDVAGAG